MNRNHLSLLSVLFLSPVFVLTVSADVRLPAIISSHMVIQRGLPVKVWGWADANEVVKLNLDKQDRTATADKDGKWAVSFDAVDSAEPLKMTVVGAKNSITVEDIITGDVWVCSGQSNMELGTRNAMNAKEEIANANYPKIRLFHVANNATEALQDDVKGEWELCSPKSIPTFTAVGYFFGRELHKNLGIPIGLIESNWGGTPAESWTDRKTLETNPHFAPIVENYNKALAEYPEAKKKHDAAMAEWKKNAECVDPGNTKFAEGWAKVDFDDSKWEAYPVPSLWEKSVKKDIDGAVWFRKQVEISDEWAGKDLNLQLGKLDDTDVTYFNGEQVGATDSGDMSSFVDRKYTVPGKLVKKGLNTIAIRIFDRGGPGGFVGPKKEMMLTLAQGTSKPILLAGEWKYAIEFAAKPKPFSWPPGEPPHKDNAWSPSNLYNGMIHPLIPFGIKGAIWYQGESNADNPDHANQYRELLGAMISGWRTNWGEGEFPFLVVQLANFMKESSIQPDSNWAVVREAEYMVTKDLPNVGMGTAVDIGDAANIHPTNKQEVGRRLALSAEKMVYGKDVVCCGPTYKSMKIDGGKAVISFDNIADGLEAHGDKLIGFAVTGSDGKWHEADAKIDGAIVVVTSSDVPQLTAVRYGWADNPICNLYNRSGLPAIPFRTDVKPAEAAK